MQNHSLEKIGDHLNITEAIVGEK